MAPARSRLVPSRSPRKKIERLLASERKHFVSSFFVIAEAIPSHRTKRGCHRNIHRRRFRGKELQKQERKCQNKK